MTAPDDLRLVVFDVDGTLVDSQAHIHAAMTHAFDSAGYPAPDLAQVRAIVGLSLPQAITRLAPHLAAAEVAELVGHYKQSFGTRRESAPAPLYPGAMDCLRRLASRSEIVLGVATGKSRRGLDHLIATHALHGMFLTRQVADDHPSKPHPSMLQAAMAETGIAGAAAAMIGDTTFDMEMARAAGIPAIGVAWGYHEAADLHRAGADVVAEDFGALDELLDGLWGRG